MSVFMYILYLVFDFQISDTQLNKQRMNQERDDLTMNLLFHTPEKTDYQKSGTREKRIYWKQQSVGEALWGKAHCSRQEDWCIPSSISPL